MLATNSSASDVKGWYLGSADFCESCSGVKGTKEMISSCSYPDGYVCEADEGKFVFPVHLLFDVYKTRDRFSNCFESTLRGSADSRFARGS